MANTTKDQIKTALRELEQERELEKNDPPLETIEDLRGLSPDTINRRWPEVSAILEAADEEEEDA